MNKEELHNSLANKVRMTFIRSSGAGGQNVNKLNTKVHAAINIRDIEGVTPQELMIMQQKLRSMINKNNEICIDVQDERYQGKNREIALQRLENSIIQASRILHKRKKTKPTYASRERRLNHKKIRSIIKKNRSNTLSFPY